MAVDTIHKVRIFILSLHVGCRRGSDGLVAGSSKAIVCCFLGLILSVLWSIGRWISLFKLEVDDGGATIAANNIQELRILIIFLHVKSLIDNDSLVASGSKVTVRVSLGLILSVPWIVALSIPTTRRTSRFEDNTGDDDDNHNDDNNDGTNDG